jgi:hypothetical protein
VVSTPKNVDYQEPDYMLVAQQQPDPSSVVILWAAAASVIAGGAWLISRLRRRSRAKA